MQLQHWTARATATAAAAADPPPWARVSECAQTQMEALQKWAALNASTFPEKLLLLLLLKRGERGVRCCLCSRSVGLMFELCWSAAGIYTRAIRWEMEMEVLNFIHQKSPGNNIGREWFIDAVIRLSVSFFSTFTATAMFLRYKNRIYCLEKSSYDSLMSVIQVWKKYTFHKLNWIRHVF